VLLAEVEERAVGDSAVNEQEGDEAKRQRKSLTRAMP
jgi:hypothetical protein